MTNELLRNTLDALQEDVWNTAEKSGWHQPRRSMGELIALIHSEASEALEEVRNGKDPSEIYWRDRDGAEFEVNDFVEIFHRAPGTNADGTPMKTEGVAAEFADVIIRILDAAGEYDIPVVDALLHKVEYNKTRPHRHGGKVL